MIHMRCVLHELQIDARNANKLLAHMLHKSQMSFDKPKRKAHVQTDSASYLHTKQAVNMIYIWYMWTLKPVLALGVGKNMWST